MAWPYQIIFSFTEAEKLQRRDLLERYGLYAQLSALIPILAWNLYRLGIWFFSEQKSGSKTIDYSEVPSSPTLKRHSTSRQGSLVTKWRSIVWWLEGELAPGWGLRGQWIAGVSWTTWLLFLCVHQTGVGMSSLPAAQIQLVDSSVTRLTLVFGSC